MTGPEHTLYVVKTEAQTLDVTTYSGPRMVLVSGPVEVTATNGEVTTTKDYELGTEPRIGEQITVVIVDAEAAETGRR